MNSFIDINTTVNRKKKEKSKWLDDMFSNLNVVNKCHTIGFWDIICNLMLSILKEQQKHKAKKHKH